MTRATRARAAVEWLFEHVWARAQQGSAGDFVTGNNDADGVFLLYWIARQWPERVADMRERLVNWGGNATGVGVANIDNLGNVHPTRCGGNSLLATCASARSARSGPTAAIR
jgi:hypothetical protein